MAKREQSQSVTSEGYLDRLTRTPLLTKEEEVTLTRQAQKGQDAARDRLVESNIRLVINIARAYRCPTIPLEDLVQEGVIGLMHAIERFDPEKGFRFSTYATHWIRQAVGRAVDGKSKTIRLPAHITQSLRKVDKAKSELLSQTGQEPTAEQIALHLGVSVRKLKTLLQASQELISLDVKVGDGDATTLGAMLQDESAGDPEAIILNSEIVEELLEIISHLNERERRIMIYRLKNDDGTADFREELSDEMHISRERVRQIETQAIKKLRLIAEQRRVRDSFASDGPMVS